MLKNKIILKLIVSVVLLLFYACGGKKVAETEEEYIPTRSDYVIAVNEAFLTAADSAAKRTQEAIWDQSELKIPLSSQVEKYLALSSSLGDTNQRTIVDAEIRQSLGRSLSKLPLELAAFLKIEKETDVKDLLARNMIAQKFLIMKSARISRILSEETLENFIGSTADLSLRKTNMLYNEYYNSDEKLNYDFKNTTDVVTYYFLETFKKEEDSAKLNYQLWDNKQGKLAMKYINNQK